MFSGQKKPFVCSQSKIHNGADETGDFRNERKVI